MQAGALRCLVDLLLWAIERDADEGARRPRGSLIRPGSVAPVRMADQRERVQSPLPLSPHVDDSNACEGHDAADGAEQGRHFPEPEEPEKRGDRRHAIHEVRRPARRQARERDGPCAVGNKAGDQTEIDHSLNARSRCDREFGCAAGQPGRQEQGAEHHVPRRNRQRLVPGEERLLNDGRHRITQGSNKDEQRAGVDMHPLPLAEGNEADPREGQGCSDPGADAEPLAEHEHRQAGRHDGVRVDDKARSTCRDRPLTHVEKSRIERHEKKASNHEPQKIRQRRPCRPGDGKKDRRRYSRNGKPQGSEFDGTEGLEPCTNGRKGRSPGEDRDDDGGGGHTIEGFALGRIGSTDGHGGNSH